MENYIISETIDVYLFRQMYLLWQHINGEVGLDHPWAHQIAHLVQRTWCKENLLQRKPGAKKTWCKVSYLMLGHIICWVGGPT